MTEPTWFCIANHQPDEYYFEEGCYVTELSNSKADAELSIARIRLPIGQRTISHKLNGITERYYIEDGEGQMHVGHEQIAVGDGDVVLIPAGVTQWIENTGSCDLVFLALCTPRFQRDAYVACAEKA